MFISFLWYRPVRYILFNFPRIMALRTGLIRCGRCCLVGTGRPTIIQSCRYKGKIILSTPLHLLDNCTGENDLGILSEPFSFEIPKQRHFFKNLSWISCKFIFSKITLASKIQNLYPMILSSFNQWSKGKRSNFLLF